MLSSRDLWIPILVGAATLAGAAQQEGEFAERLRTDPSGHYVCFRENVLMLVGESGTQCVMQNANLDYHAWLDDCADRGIRMVHLWAFLGARQKADGSLVEERWGYVYPALTPWARREAGPKAADQLPQWDLTRFDEGPDDALDHYWPRIRDLCRHAKGRNLVVGITVFTGWSKGNHNTWAYHPLNVVNGGHLTDNEEAVVIESPGTEVWQEPWDGAWPNPRKTQWVWERLARKFIDELDGYGNVFFVFFDEHSYGEGNMGDHFLEFFRGAGAAWVDWETRREAVDFVYSDTKSGSDKNAIARQGFGRTPARPYLLLEGGPYAGEDVRSSLWTFSVGGGHFTFHADEGQETARTGIMGYDAHVQGGDMGMLKRDWLGHASRFFNEHLQHLGGMTPQNDLVGEGAYCLAAPGREYAVYSMIGAAKEFTVDLQAVAGRVRCRFYDPRTGRFEPEFARPGGATETFKKPDEQDWALHILADPEP